MPWSYEIDEAGGLIRFRFHGLVSNADVLDADQAMRDDPAFRAELDQIVDMTGIEEMQLTPAGVRELSERPPIFSLQSRRAIVVGGDLGYGLARVYQARRGDVAGEIQVFRASAEAEVWLSQPTSGGSGDAG